MTASELFGVSLRLIGIIAAIIYLPALVQLQYVAAAPGVVGLILVTQADLITRLCYPKNPRERELRDFRER